MAIDFARLDEKPHLEFSHEHILGFLLPESRHASASVGIVPPHGSQRHHLQRRPDGGVENILIFRGKFGLEPAVAELEGHDCATAGPVFVHVPSETPLSIRNLGDDPVWFYTVFAPPFSPGEVAFLGPE